MNELLEALSNLLSVVVEDARAHNLDQNHRPNAEYQQLRTEMARLAYGLDVYLEKHT